MKTILLALIFTMSSCAHNYRERLDQSLTSWLGQHPDQLVEAWGAPRSTYVLESGAKALTFEESSINSRSYGYSYYWRPEVYSYTEHCKITFVTDVSPKKLERYSYTGQVNVCMDIINAHPTPSRR